MMLITPTNVHPFAISRVPFDIVVNALFDHGHKPERSLQQKHVLKKYAQTSGPKMPPDMILNAFDVKLHS